MGDDCKHTVTDDQLCKIRQAAESVGADAEFSMGGPAMLLLVDAIEGARAKLAKAEARPLRAAEQLVRLGTQVDSLTRERDACRAALDRHDAALRNRRHGGVAAGHCVYEVRNALEAPDFVDNLGPVGDIVPDGEG